MENQDIELLVHQVEVWHIQGYTACASVMSEHISGDTDSVFPNVIDLVASVVTLLYYYVTTLDDEASKIWPQPSWKAGKILFLVSRYSNYARIVVICLYGWPNHNHYSLSTCTSMQRAWWGLTVIGVTIAPECIYWLCFYALLGGRRVHFALMAGVFLFFLVPIQILQGIYISDATAIPVSELRTELGFPCTQGGSLKPLALYTTAAYLGLARTTLVMAVAIATLSIGYRKQNHALINVIRREGCIFYALAFVVGFLNSVANTPPRPPIRDDYLLLRM
ncbi:hypothetical protein NMY22_g11132 [Coprinellus aureogranulatus]|nr:hypothetical protein NMY22_g11132 [Coprinellus aureogranulatus]